MKLKQPKKVRLLFAERKQWVTIGEIADNLKLHRNTVSKFLKGEKIDASTAKAIASAVNEDVMSIAEFTN
jgi:plasmid maintenance system antidote protein VapI